MRETADRLEKSVGAGYEPFAFAADLAARIYATDIVLARAGAGTLSEVSAAGIPMVLVPGPFAGGHQKLNATPYAEAGAAVVVPDDECNAERLTQVLGSIAGDPHSMGEW